MEWEILVDTAETGNEMVFERADGAFGGIATVHAGRDELKVDIGVVQKLLECRRAFVVEAVEFGSEASGDEARMEGLECL